MGQSGDGNGVMVETMLAGKSPATKAVVSFSRNGHAICVFKTMSAHGKVLSKTLPDPGGGNAKKGVEMP
jgi:hypothetical protein